MSVIPETVMQGFEQGGSLAILADLYLQSESLHLTTWQRHLRYLDPVSGAYVYYTPAPFWVSDDGITHDPKEVAILQVRLGAWTGIDTTAFTASQAAQFSEHLADIEEYLTRRDPRGAMAILRIVNPYDLSGDISLFVGIVDEWVIDSDGIVFEISEAEDILGANAYPLSPTCGYSFGDPRCGVDRESAANKYTGTAGVGSDAEQLVDADIDPNPDGYWDVAIVEFTSGENEGSTREVATYDHTTGTIVFDIPLDYAVASGDAYVLRRKCKKTFNHCGTMNATPYRFGGNPFLNDSVQGLYYRGKA